MSTSPQRQKGIHKKVIVKRKKLVDSAQEDEQRMTRFRTKAKTCTICYCSIESQGVIDSCKHEFCFTCIEKWSQTENTCPLCKKRFSSLKKSWNRHFYGKKPAILRKKKANTEDKPSEKEEEIAIPTRNQGQSNRSGLSENLTEQLLYIMMRLFPPLSSESDSSEDEFSLILLSHDPALISLTRLSANDLRSFSNSE